MALRDSYRRQVALLVRVLPLVGEEPDFALKGGTAINLFVRDMPRLSVDIDLTYLPVQDRAASLAAIDTAMQRISTRIQRTVPDARITPTFHESATTKLLIRTSDAQIKIEVTPVLRGCVYDPVLMSVSPAVEESFGFAQMQVISFADLYAGKIVAALDRQHPRDLYDVRELLAHEGIDDALRNAFLVYIISHGRPIGDVLAPTRKPLEQEFRRGFEGMTAEPVLLTDLEAAREAIIDARVGGMSADHRHFLLSFKRGTPDWSLLDIPAAQHLPAVQWKQRNLDQLTKARRAMLADKLEKLLLG